MAIRIALVGNYLPRQCGIATFTTDLCEALASESPEVSCIAVPVNDTEAGYDYPERVRFELSQDDVASYERAADFLNLNEVDLVCLQHEYGIFGGEAGSHILALLRRLHVPIVTTLHTVLRNPEPAQRRALMEIAERSDRFVAMSRNASGFLEKTYGIAEERIEVIPHGIPEMPFVDPNYYKDQFSVEGKMVLLTFGLLSPNKGIETVIRALPAILRDHPDVVYIVLGATHPHVLRREGESYRLALQAQAEQLGVQQSVRFHNRFVTLQELIEFIGAADIYVTPYLNAEQIVSGTLAYAVGAGKAVVSTPYWYARELLAGGRGRLVPFADPAAMAETVNELLVNRSKRHAIRKKAYLLGREMTWPKVARRYLETFERARAERSRSPRHADAGALWKARTPELPAPSLDHLRRLTDDTGLLQHATFTVPNYTMGYTTDDNARGLIVSVLLEEEARIHPEAGLLAYRYLSFLYHAFNETTGVFRNEMSYDRRWVGETGSEDCHGRALWALGTVLARSTSEGLRNLAGKLFFAALPATVRFTCPRAWALTLMGIHEYLKAFHGDRVAQSIAAALSERLSDCYRSSAAPGWSWFEPCLTYGNATLPHGLLLGARLLSRQDMAGVALTSLEWLASIQRVPEGHFVPIGCKGWYRRGEERARFDQQPLEAQATVSAALEAWRFTGDEAWREEAQRAFDWFLGRNDLGLSLYDETTGGCRDGLQPERLNDNQGAESTLSFLLALLEMRHVERAFMAGSEHEHATA